MEKPLVSVIMPVHNGARFMHRAIDSVISQDFDNWQLVIIDDNSQDESYKVAYNYAAKDNRIVAIRNQSGSHGANAARNVGIRAAEGKFISFLDCDDYYLENSLKDRITCFEADDKLSLVYGNAFSEAGHIRFKWVYDKVDDADLNRYLAEELSLCSQNTIMVKKADLMKMGCLDESLKCWTDDDLLLSSSFEKKVKHCGKFLAVVIKDNSIMTSNKENAYRGLKKVIKKYQKRIIKYAGLKRLALWYIRLFGAFFYARAYKAKDGSFEKVICLGIHEKIKGYCKPFFRRYFE